MLVRCGSAGPGRHMLGSQGPWLERDQGAAARHVRQAEAANMAVSLLFAFCGGGVWACQGWDTVVGIWGDWAGVETRGDAWSVVVTRDPVCDNTPMNACLHCWIGGRNAYEWMYGVHDRMEGNTSVDMSIHMSTSVPIHTSLHMSIHMSMCMHIRLRTSGVRHGTCLYCHTTRAHAIMIFPYTRRFLYTCLCAHVYTRMYTQVMTSTHVRISRISFAWM